MRLPKTYPELRRRLAEAGCVFDDSRRHVKVIGPDGACMFLPQSGSDWRGVANACAEARQRLGVSLRR